MQDNDLQDQTGPMPAEGVKYKIQHAANIVKVTCCSPCTSAVHAHSSQGPHDLTNDA